MIAILKGHTSPEPHDMAHADALANARLIAAAPDLLAALRSIEANLLRPMTANARTQREKLLEIARAAIAKVEGNT